MNTILLIEDNIMEGRMAIEALEKEYYHVIHGKDYKDAINLFKIYKDKIELIILDIILSDKYGEDVLMEIRKISDVAVIIHSSINHTLFQKRFVKLKIDDYIVKPCIEELLVMKVNKIIRENENKKLQMEKSKEEIWEYKDLKIDFKRMVIYKENTLCKIGKIQWALLQYLFNNKGLVLSRNQIINEVWGYEKYISDRTVDSHISKLKKALELNCIKSVSGIGYILEV